MPTNLRRKKRNKRELAFLIVLLCGLSYAIYVFAASGSGRTVKANFIDSSGKPIGPFSLEIASTRGERSRGLMYRKPGEMRPDQGMIFIFPQEARQSFWMKNTYISLDMLFLDSQMKIVGILADVPVLNESPRQIESPSQYVVELLAGTASARGIAVGQILKVDGQLPEASF